MGSATARGIWCHTCGTYIRPGTHGIHEMRYGAGGAAPRDEMSDARAVVLVVMLLAGFMFSVFALAFCLMRAAR